MTVRVAVVFVCGFILGVAFQRYLGFRAVLPAAVIAVLGGEVPSPARDDAADTGDVEALYGTLSLFILAGQSNMSGRGELPAAQTLHPGIIMFGNDYRWKRASEPVDDSTGQVDPVSLDSRGDPPGFGPSLSFALALAERYPAPSIGLIPCAKGNTTIREWQRSVSDRTLYGSCMKRARAASMVGQMAGLLFFQGEADALTTSNRVLTTTEYATRFSEVIEGFRRDLAAPRLAVVFAQIGRQDAPESFRNWELVRQQQQAVRLPCTAMIRTGDLPLRDGVHFTTDAYRAIGRRFAEAYARLAGDAACRP